MPHRPIVEPEVRMRAKRATRFTPWYHGWNIVAASVLAQGMVMGLPVNALSLFLKTWSAEFRAPVSTLLLSMTFFGIAAAIYSPVTGWLADKFPARLIFGAGLFGAALAALAISFMTTAWQMLLLWAVVVPATLSLATLVPSNAVVSRWFVKRLGLAMGISAFGQSIAGVLGPPIVARALATMDWRHLFRLDALLVAVVVAPLVMWVMRDRPSERDGLHYIGVATPSPDDALAAVSGRGEIGSIIQRKTFWVLLAVSLPIIAGCGTCLYNLGPIAENHGFGEQTAATLLSTFSIAQILSTVSCGMLSDRFGNRVPLAALAVIAGAGLAVIGFGTMLPVVLVGTAMVGAGGGFWPLLSAATVGEFGAARFGLAFGLMGFCMPLGNISSVLVARAQEATGSYGIGLSAVGAVMAAGGLVCLIWLREKRAASPGEGAAMPSDHTP
jgi:MFS family permease